jgi:hypothetical protein
MEAFLAVYTEQHLFHIVDLLNHADNQSIIYFEITVPKSSKNADQNESP